VIRQKPFTKDKKLTGYYLYIRKGEDRDRAEAVREDRITGTDAKGLPEPLDHPKRGKIAQKR
jgi:hypothetical protein